MLPLPLAALYVQTKQKWCSKALPLVLQDFNVIFPLMLMCVRLRLPIVHPLYAPCCIVIANTSVGTYLLYNHCWHATAGPKRGLYALCRRNSEGVAVAARAA